VIAVMLTHVGSRSIKRYIIYMLVLHYLGFAIYLLALHSQDYKDFFTVWNRAPIAWTWHVMIYLAGQVYIWWAIAFRKIPREPRSAA
jgi:K+ transporter